MVDILHRVGIRTSQQRAYEALATRAGLAAWWTEDTRGDSTVGGVLQFRFPAGGFDMKVLELAPAERVRWEVIDGPEEWVGTGILWQLRQQGDHAIVLFKHENWPAPVDFMHHCSTKWAIFLMSLKSLLETGKGSPAPHDVKIDDWN
jgi:uncharacterized protein YndB with AHSA1/START domain